MTANQFIWKIIILTFFLFPWYYLESGGFQIVDISIIFLLLALIIFANTSFRVLNEKAFKIYLFFWSISILLILINFIVSSNIQTLILFTQNLYYTVLLVCFSALFLFMYQENSIKFYQRIEYLLLVYFILPLVFFASGKNYGAMGGRFSLSFNNPNQLGFLALISLCIFFYNELLAKEAGVKLKKWLSVLILNITLFFLALSVTRAAAGMLLLYVLSYLLIFNDKFKTRKSVAYYLFIMLFFIVGITIIGEYAISHIEITRGMIGSRADPNLGQDIYNRAFEGINLNITNGWYLFFGTGQDARLDSAVDLEYHNNFMNIFSEIGLIGLCVYIYFTLYILRGLYQKGLIYTLPYLVYLFYSMLQFTFRTRLNWLFLAFVIFVLFSSRQKRISGSSRELKKEK